MEKIWLKNYPPGVPADINPDIYQSLVEVINETCKTHADRPAFYNMGVTISFAELDYYSSQFAGYLQNELKLKKGDRMAIMMPNALQYPIVLFGALKAGLAAVNVNPLYTSDELTHQIENAQAETIVVLENFANVVEAALPKLPHLKNVIISQLGDFFPTTKRWITHLALKYYLKRIPKWSIPKAVFLRNIIFGGNSWAFNPVTITNEDIAFLQYTGGTTGIAKGAVLTHRNIIANMLQAEAWFQNFLGDKQEIIITALPLYHIFSLLANCLYFSKIGGLNILITNPRDIPALIKEMKRFKFTAITGVNTLFNALLKNQNVATIDFGSLQLALGGGMAVQKVVAERWQALTKAPLLEAYGLTETSPCVTINPTYLKAYNGSIGLPVPSTDVCFLDENQQEVPLNTPGELAVKGPQVMRGYWNNPTETDKAFTKDGWLLTGDIASIDEQGFIRILERKKDMILVSGFNVYPNEVEAVLAALPGVKEVAVVGMVDENSGEAVKAFIVKETPSLTEQDVIQYARKHLTGYKIPKVIEFRQDLPKSNVGKILRRALK